MGEPAKDLEVRGGEDLPPSSAAELAGLTPAPGSMWPQCEEDDEDEDAAQNDPSDDLDSDEDAQVQRLAHDLAALARFSPVARALSPNKVQALARASQQDPHLKRRNGNFENQSCNDVQNSKDTTTSTKMNNMKDSITAEPPRDADVFALLGEEAVDRATEELGVAYDGPAFAKQVVDGLKMKLAEVYINYGERERSSQPQMIGKKSSSGREFTLRRCVLQSVLTQLLLEGDIVLHRALLRYPLFDAPGARSARRRRKSKRRNSFLHELNPAGMVELQETLAALYETASIRHSLVAYLIAAKCLLGLFIYLREVKSDEGVVFAETHPVLEQELKALAQVSIPTPTQALADLRREMTLEELIKLGAIIPSDELVLEELEEDDDLSDDHSAFMRLGFIPRPTSSYADSEESTQSSKADVSLLSMPGTEKVTTQPLPPNASSSVSARNHVRNRNIQKPNRNEAQSTSSRRVRASAVNKSSRLIHAAYGESQYEEHDGEDLKRTYSKEQELDFYDSEPPGVSLSLLYGRSVLLDQKRLSITLSRTILLDSDSRSTVEHRDYRCDACAHGGPLVGSRFECAECESFDLCLDCFLAQEHNLDHAFYLHRGYRSGNKVLLPPRNSPEVSIVGLPCAAVSFNNITVIPETDVNARFAWETVVSRDTQNCMIGWVAVDCDFDSANQQNFSGLGESSGTWGISLDTGIVKYAGQELGVLELPKFAEGEHLRILCWVDPETRQGGFALGSSAIAFSFYSEEKILPASVIPAASFRNSFELKTSPEITFNVNLASILQTWYNPSTHNPADANLPSGTSLYPLAAVVEPACFYIPRGDAVSSAILVDDPGYSSVLKLIEDFTFEAMICWEPELYGTPESAAQIYTLFSRTDLDLSKSSYPCTRVGLVGDGYLFTQLQYSESSTWSQKAVIIPGKWHHIRVAVYARSYRRPSVCIVVDGSMVNTDTRKRRLQSDSDASQGDLATPTNESRFILDSFWNTKLEARRGIWVIGAQPRWQIPENELDTTKTNNHEESEVSMKPLVMNQFQGHLAEIRCWKRSLGARELQNRGGRVFELDESLRKILLFRLRADEAEGRYLHRSGDELLELHNCFKIMGEARMDTTFIPYMLKESLQRDTHSAAPVERHSNEKETSHSTGSTPNFSQSILKYAEKITHSMNQREGNQNIIVRLKKARQNIARTFLHTLGSLLRMTREFVSSQKDLLDAGISLDAPTSSVQPHVHTFLLLQSLVRQLVQDLETCRERNTGRKPRSASMNHDDDCDEETTVTWMLISVLQMMKDNLEALSAQKLNPASVGLGLPPQHIHTTASESGIPNVIKLRSSLLDIVDRSKILGGSASSELREGALRCLGEGFGIFYAHPTDRRGVLTQLFLRGSFSQTATSSHSTGSSLVPRADKDREYLLSLLCDNLVMHPNRLAEALQLVPSASKSSTGRTNWTSELSRREALSQVSGPLSGNLRWSVDFVRVSLHPSQSSMSTSAVATAANLNLGSDNVITKRKVVRYMQQVAPSQWLGDCGLNQNEVILVRALPSERVVELYTDLAARVQSGEFSIESTEEDFVGDTETTTRPTHEIKAETAEESHLDSTTNSQQHIRHAKQHASLHKDLVQLVYITLRGITNDLGQRKGNVLSNSSSKQEAGLKLLRIVLSFIQSQVWGETAENISSPTSMHLIQNFLWRGFQLTRLRSASNITMTSLDDNSSSDQPQSNSSEHGDEQMSVEAWWSDPIVVDMTTSGPSQFAAAHVDVHGVELSTKFASRFVEVRRDGRTVIHRKNKHWGTVLSNVGYANRSGTHSWKVKIIRCNGNSHMFVGIGGKGMRLDSFIGNDKKSFGFLLGGDIYHNAKATQRGVCSTNTFSSGSTVLLTLDTNAQTLEIADANSTGTHGGSGRIIGLFPLPEVFKHSDDGLIYPAICTYEEGDTAQLVAYTDGEPSHGHWMLNNSKLRSQLNKTVAKNLFVEEVMETILVHVSSAYQHHRGIKLLDSVLTFPIAWILLWPLTNLNWVERVCKHLQIIQRAQLGCSDTDKVCNLTMLTSAALGKVCSALIVSKPISVGLPQYTPGNVNGLHGDSLPTSTFTNESQDTDLEDDKPSNKSSSTNDASLLDAPELMKWCNSNLLMHGLRSDGCLLHDLQGRVAWQTSLASHHDVRDKSLLPVIEDQHTAKHSALPDGVVDIISNRGAARHLHQWLSRHLNLHQYPKDGAAYDDDISRVTLGIVAAMLHHTGWLNVAMQMAHDLAEHPSSKEVQVRPHPDLVAIWRSAHETRAWIVRQMKSSTSTQGLNSGGTFLHSIKQAVRFLFDFEPAISPSDEEINAPAAALAAFRESLGLPLSFQSMLPSSRSTSNLSSTASHLQSKLGSPPTLTPTSSVPSFQEMGRSRFLARSRSLGSSSIRSSWSLGQSLLSSAASRAYATFQDVVSQVVSFIHDILSPNEVTIGRLHDRFIRLRLCASMRERGFRALAATLSNMPLSIHTLPLYAAALLPVSSALRNWQDESTSTNQKPWHYLTDLGASGVESQMSVAAGFAALGRSLAELLQASSVFPPYHAASLHLAILDTLGVKLAPVDHELLARTSLLETLHRIMDSTREAIGEDSQIDGPKKMSDQDVQTNVANQLVGRAAMKTFYLLCSQVAASRPVTNSSVSKDMHPMLLSHVRSGPQSLNASVFNLLLHELCSAAEIFTESKEEQEQNNNPRDAPEPADDSEKVTFLPENRSFETKAFLPDMQDDAVLHMEEITSVVLSTCTTPSCHRRISSPEWLSILCSLAQNGPDSVQQNIFRIFRGMLPLINPSEVHLEDNEVHNIGEFLLEIAAGGFYASCNSSLQESKLLQSIEAIRTLRKLQRFSHWKSTIHSLLEHAIDAGSAILTSAGEGEASTPATSVSSGLDEGDTATIDSHASGRELDGGQAKTFSFCNAALAVISGTVLKLMPGAPVHAFDPMHFIIEMNTTSSAFYQLAWTQSGGSKDLSDLEKLEVWRRFENRSTKTINFDKQLIHIGADHVYLRQDINAVRLNTDSGLLKALQHFSQESLPYGSWLTSSWRRDFELFSTAPKTINVRDAPDDAAAVIGNLNPLFDPEEKKSSLVVTASQRVGLWIQLESFHENNVEDKQDATLSQAAWVKIQDAENDYVLRPKLESQVKTSLCYQKALAQLLGIQALANLSFQKSQKTINLEDRPLQSTDSASATLSYFPERNLSVMLDLAFRKIPLFRIPDLNVLSERLTILLDELSRGRNSMQGSQTMQYGSKTAESVQSLDELGIQSNADEIALDSIELSSNHQAQSGAAADLAPRRSRRMAGENSNSSRRVAVPAESVLTLMDMGFPRRWAEFALQRNGLDVTAAISYICTHGDLLDERIALAMSRSQDEQSEEEAEEPSYSIDDEPEEVSRSEITSGVTDDAQNESGGTDSRGSENPAPTAAAAAAAAISASSGNKEETPHVCPGEDDYLEMDNLDRNVDENELASASSISSYTGWDNRGQGLEGKVHIGGRRSGSKYRNEKNRMHSELQRASQRHWGPSADSRASYRHLLEKYSLADLYEEFRYLAEVLSVLQARVVILRILIVEGGSFNAFINETQRAKLVQLLVSESFQKFPLYAHDCLRSITGDAKACLWNIPKSIYEFSSTCISRSKSFVAELLLCVKQTLRRAASAEFSADTQQVRDDSFSAVESSESMLWFVDWATRQLLSVAPLGSELHLTLFTTWLLALRSPSVRIKISALSMLSDFLDAAASIENGATRINSLYTMIQALPWSRLLALINRLLRRRDGASPGPSLFCKELLQFVAKVEQYKALLPSETTAMKSSQLELTQSGFMELRDVNGEALDSLQPPWTASFWIRHPPGKDNQHSELGAEPRIILGDSSSSSSLQIILTSNKLGIRFNDGKISSFGFTLPAPKEGEEVQPWTKLTLVCADYPETDAMNKMFLHHHMGCMPKTDEKGGSQKNLKGYKKDSYSTLDAEGEEYSTEDESEVGDDNAEAESNWTHDEDDVESYLSDGVFQMNTMGVEAYLQFHKISHSKERTTPKSLYQRTARSKPRPGLRSNIQTQEIVHILAYENDVLRGSICSKSSQSALGIREVGSPVGASFDGSIGRLCLWKRAMSGEQAKEISRHLLSLGSNVQAIKTERPGMECETAEPILALSELYSYWDFTHDTNSLSNNVLNTDTECNDSPHVKPPKEILSSVHMLIEALHHKHVGILRSGARITSFSEDHESCLSKQSESDTGSLKLQTALYERIEPSLHYLISKTKFSGVILWDLEEISLLRQVAVPMDFQTAHLPMHLYLRLTGDCKLVGHFECTEHDKNVWCKVEGHIDASSHNFEIYVTQVVLAENESRRWLSNLMFEGHESNGELEGTWKTSRKLPHWHVLSEDAPTMRAVARSAPAYLSLDEEGQLIRATCDILHLQSTFPPFVLDQRPTVSTWSTVILETGRWYPVLQSSSNNDEAEEQSLENDSMPHAMEPATWACPACTFLNQLDHSCCAICTTPNPDQSNNSQGGDVEAALFTLDAEGVWEPNSGVYMWEFQVKGSAGSLQRDDVSFGLCAKGTPLRDHLGATEHSWGISSSGLSWFKGRNKALLKDPLRDGDKISLELDSDHGRVSIFINDKEVALCDRSALRRGTECLFDNALFPAIAISARANVSILCLGLKHGQGTVHFSELKRYTNRSESGSLVRFDGSWKLGRRSGPGILKEASGTVFEGNWVDGLLEGWCKVTSRSASEVKYEFFEKGIASSTTKATTVPPENFTKFSLKDASDESKNQQQESQTDNLFDMQGKFAFSSHQLVRLDPTTAGPGIHVSADCLSAEYVGVGPDAGKRSHVLGAEGYSRGMHYWEARVMGMQWGSTLIGVTDRHPSQDGSPRLRPGNEARGEGWGDGFGFVNYRATHSPDGEQLYGSFYAVNDVVGVLLDMDRGRLYFFKDFQDYQSGDKQVIVDLGLAYDQLRQKCRLGRRKRIPSEDIKLYPCFGMSKVHDKITMEKTRSLEYNEEPEASMVFEYSQTVNMFREILAPRPSADEIPLTWRDELFSVWENTNDSIGSMRTVWSLGRIPVHIHISPGACAAASVASLGNVQVGDRLNSPRGPVTILGARNGALWYCVDGSDEALFWPPAEFRSLVKDKKVWLEDDQHKELQTMKEAHSMLPSTFTPDDLVNALQGRNDVWTDALDRELVLVVNVLCDRYACEPEHLQLISLVKEMQHAETASQTMRRLIGLGPQRLIARFIILLTINIRIRKIFELVNLETTVSDPGQIVFASDHRSGDGEQSRLACRKMQVAGLLAYGRSLIFTRTKLEYWNACIARTTTPTIPAADEYDAPPDFPSVRVNRIIAGDQRLAALEEHDRLQTSVFGQIMVKTGMESWPARKLRRAYSHIQDATQQRCFFVKFESEGVDDHGGPYRAVFQIAIEEEAAGPLQILVPCPNAADGALANADRMVFTPLRHQLEDEEDEEVQNTGNKISSGAFTSRKCSGRSDGEAKWPSGAAGSERCIKFLGRLLGVATRHSIHIGLCLAHIIWRPLVGLPIGWRELHEIDSFTTRSLRQIESLSREQWDDEDAAWSELLLDRLGDAKHNLPAGSVITHHGKPSKIPFEARFTVVEEIVRQSVLTAAAPVTTFMQGLEEILPTRNFILFTPEELEKLICGAPEIDIELLKRATIYEDVDPEAPHVVNFWRALEDMTQEERSKFVNFVCARSRLPSSVDKFPMSFKIIPLIRKQDNDEEADGKAMASSDGMLPQSQTCFFTLGLPEYSSKEVCYEKLLYAANNCNTMEDFDEHDAQAFSGLE